MAAQWFYRRGEEQCGPISLDQLRQLLASRQVAPSDFVWTKGMKDWISAGSITGRGVRPSWNRLTSSQRAGVVIGLGAVLSLSSCCVCGGILSLFGDKTPDRKEAVQPTQALGSIQGAPQPSDNSASAVEPTITADYFPFKPGSSTDYILEMAPQTTVRVQKNFQSDGKTIVQRWISGTQDGKVVNFDRKTSEASRHSMDYRVQDGYVEIGEQKMEEAGFRWEPVLKIGALKGQSWSSAIGDRGQHGQHRFTVEKFGEYSLMGKNYPCVIVHHQITGQDGSVLVDEELTYVKNIGMALKKGTGGSASFKWTLWDPGEHWKNLTAAEKSFFQ